VFEKVDVQTWIYATGLPEQRHRPTSHLYDEVQKALNEYEKGIKPTKEQINGWHRYQVLSFLQGLPHEISVEDCRYFDEILELDQKNDVAFFSYFYVIAIASGYREILPRVEQFMGKIGRMLYVLPIVRVMIDTEWSREHIRPLFARVRDRHHQITANAIEGLLRGANL
jgi:leukotriene-A4 hydrolase